jgi:hypothetical protein
MLMIVLFCCLVRDAKRYRHLADRERWASAPQAGHIHDEVKRVVFQHHTEQRLDPQYGEDDLRLALERVLNAYALYNPSVGYVTVTHPLPIHHLFVLLYFESTL